MGKKEKTGLEKVKALLVAPVETDAAPAFIAPSEEGREEITGQDLIFSRLILMQAKSKQVEELRLADSGDVLDSLSNQVVFTRDEEQEFTPLLFYREWIEWHPKDTGLGIKESSRDSHGSLARRCLADERRLEGTKEVRAVTAYLNFVVHLKDTPLTQLYVLGFSRTGYRVGKMLLSLATFRGKFPLYAGRYVVSTTLTESKGPERHKYMTFSLRNAKPAWVTDQPTFLAYQKAHQGLREAKDRIQPPPAEEADALDEAEAGKDETGEL